MQTLVENKSLLTDLYQLTMMQAYFDDGRANDSAAFDYFFRKLPFNGGFVVFAGLDESLNELVNLKFNKDELNYLSKLGFSDKFLDYLGNFRFTGDIYSFEEGSIVFPNEPILSVRGKLIECQFVETLLLNILNFYSLIATKAARMRIAAGNKVLSDFGLRRSQGLGGIQASRASIIGGFDSTSNVLAAYKFDLKAVGTMAHSYIQSYDNELTAFRKFAQSHPDNCTLLIDTYDTLNSGLPNAITIAKELEEKGLKLNGVRLDSGDLIKLSKQVRKILDEAKLNYVKIVASNQLDEYTIQEIIEQKAPIDIFGVGTNLVTGQPDAALDGVYKLSSVNNKPSLKLSDTNEKITLPGFKQVLRFKDQKGEYIGDAVVLEDEESVNEMILMNEENSVINTVHHKSVGMLQPVMKAGVIILKEKTNEGIREKVKENLTHLKPVFKKLKEPETYQVGISKKLMELKEILASKYNSRSLIKE